jgi:hypothetical protein
MIEATATLRITEPELARSAQGQAEVQEGAEVIADIGDVAIKEGATIHLQIEAPYQSAKKERG